MNQKFALTLILFVEMVTIKMPKTFGNYLFTQILRFFLIISLLVIERYFTKEKIERLNDRFPRKKSANDLQKS